MSQTILQSVPVGKKVGIAFSGGRIGCQIEMTPDDLARAVPLAVADLTVV